jgi:hypothetical protein
MYSLTQSSSLSSLFCLQSVSSTIYLHFLLLLPFLAGSKFPFMQNTPQMPPQQQQQPSQNNWPGMHMGFNQNSNDGGFPQHPSSQPPQQHKPTGKG